ncbi:MAG: hypothetical protein ABR576_15625 [Thermoanaerobaculia bacterium]
MKRIVDALLRRFPHWSAVTIDGIELENVLRNGSIDRILEVYGFSAAPTAGRFVWYKRE